MSERNNTQNGDTRIKFMVIASEAPEARLAAFFAGRRARRSNARVTLLAIVEPPEFGHWATVAETMRAEAYEKAENILREFAAEVKAQSGEDPEEVVREGVLVEELRKLIEEDPAISILVLGASTEASGPGPLVTALAKNPAYLGARPIPVTVVPGAMTRDELRRLAG
ncbi:universal stress protein [Hyphococcus sp.]|jgi:nucleotide-binding universal stress UspA family protein|uniref:universal stress protein n=1 Tax=Hyphococcus sp. TaxID=2038636 RepID=UPI003D143E1E